MRWLLAKDARILRRSPLLAAGLVVYPALVAVLIGLALSGGPAKPRVAFANLVPPEQGTFTLGEQVIDTARYARELFRAIDPVRVSSRAEAVAKVRSGETLAALVVPSDVADKLQAAVNLAASAPPTLEVVYNAEDPVKRRFVESTIAARVADANRALSAELTRVAAGYLDILLTGGSFSVLGRQFDVLGLTRSHAIVRRTLAGLPADSPARAELQRVADFSRLAIENLDLSDEVLGTIGAPIRIERTVLSGARTPLDAFAVAVAVTVSLMFVALLLGSGMLALEREERAFTRLVRGLVPRTVLLAEKALFAAACALVVGLVMLAGLALFVGLDWGRAPLWLGALAAAAAAFGAMGAALGALAREVRAASLLAFGLSLPIAFLALVPSGTVAPDLHDATRVISALFPFAPALDALDAALNDAGGFGGALARLGAVALGWGALGRLALARFA